MVYLHLNVGRNWSTQFLQSAERSNSELVEKISFIAARFTNCIDRIANGK
jgi:hypothetical protein